MAATGTERDYFLGATAAWMASAASAAQVISVLDLVGPAHPAHAFVAQWSAVLDGSVFGLLDERTRRWLEPRGPNNVPAAAPAEPGTSNLKRLLHAIEHLDEDGWEDIIRARQGMAVDPHAELQFRQAQHAAGIAAARAGRVPEWNSALDDTDEATQPIARRAVAAVMYDTASGKPFAPQQVDALARDLSQCAAMAACALVAADLLPRDETTRAAGPFRRLVETLLDGEG